MNIIYLLNCIWIMCKIIVSQNINSKPKPQLFLVNRLIRKLGPVKAKKEKTKLKRIIVIRLSFKKHSIWVLESRKLFFKRMNHSYGQRKEKKI